MLSKPTFLSLGLTFLVSFCFLNLGSNISRGADDELTIKKIMKVAFKGDLVRKAGTGKATPAEQKQLLEMVKAMKSEQPPKGGAESWEEKSNAVIEAVQAVIDGKEDAAMLLKKSTNCSACHKVHKP